MFLPRKIYHFTYFILGDQGREYIPFQKQCIDFVIGTDDPMQWGFSPLCKYCLSFTGAGKKKSVEELAEILPDLLIREHFVVYKSLSYPNFLLF